MQVTEILKRFEQKGYKLVAAKVNVKTHVLSQPLCALDI